MAALTSLFISFLFGEKVINILQKKQIGQPVRSYGPIEHLKKRGTPTMGGILIVACVLLSTLLWARLDNIYVWLTIIVLVSFALLGFIDDYKKVIAKNSKGVKSSTKILWQLVTCVVVIYALYYIDFDTKLFIPLFKNIIPDIGLWIFVLAIIVIIGSSNAVNLTDGLDGLAIGPVIMTSIAFMILSYISGHIEFSNYLNVFYLSRSGELSIICASIFGAGIGFLWYNTFPAQVFMGDVGALSLGGALGVIAILTKNEILFMILGGIFVVETLSVIIQVVYFKVTHGKRIFLMAPLHHHFELAGWAEPKIIVRFWIISIILGLIGMGTLKLR
jgi:phospho-N-acetylmuramoyl-pentapeptide-transferase